MADFSQKKIDPDKKHNCHLREIFGKTVLLKRRQTKFQKYLTLGDRKKKTLALLVSETLDIHLGLSVDDRALEPRSNAKS